MSSTRRYWDQPETSAFTARVTAAGEHQGRRYVELAETWFYPESGGQLPDRGRIGEAEVVDVQEEGGRILHFLGAGASPIEVGAEVPASLDRERRLDHMQQHTGQHMLSAALLEVAGIATLSFHMGGEGSTIDLDVADLDADLLARVEDLVNARILEDRPIRVLYPGEGEVAGLGLRKDPQVSGPLRVIDIEGFDRSPCGGTHCTRTGQVGQVHLSGVERVRQKARLAFVAGRRALLAHRAKNRVVRELAALVSARPEELGVRIADLQERLRLAGKELAGYQAEAWSREAESLATGAVPAGRARLLVVHGEREPERRKAMALRLAGVPDLVAALTTPAGDLNLSAGTDTGFDCGKALPALAKELGGKGGGSRSTAQGRLDPARIGEVEARLRAILEG